MGAVPQGNGRRTHPLRRFPGPVACLLTVACLAGMTQVLSVAGSGSAPAPASNVQSPPPSTSVLLPSNGATQSGAVFLDASASPNVTKVVFVLTGGAVGHRVISGSSPTLYGWIGAWNTATVPDGTYVLQSVASYADGESGASPGLTIAVYNGTLRSDGSVEEAWLTGAHPGDQITLMQHGRVVANPANPGVAGSLGAIIIRDVQPGPGYWWLDDTTGQRARRSPSWHRATTPRPIRPSTRTSRCTRGSTTSRCVTALSWRPRCAIPTTRPVRRPAPAPR